MNTVKLLAIFAENKPGQTARITQVLAEAGVNIRWMTVASSGRFGVMKLLADRYDLALQGLKQKGFMVSHLEALAVEVQDKPGALHAVAECLAQHQINLENSSGFVAHNRAVLIIEVHELAQARQILEEQGLRVLSQEEMLSL